MRTSVATCLLFAFLAIARLADGATPPPPEPPSPTPQPREPTPRDLGPRVKSGVVLPTKNERGHYQRQLTVKGYAASLDLDSQVIALNIPKEESWRTPNQRAVTGDTVVVERGGASLMSGQQRIASLPAGQVLGVSRLEGDHVFVATVVAGQTKSGWVKSSQLKFKSSAPELYPTLDRLPSDRLTSAAALSQKAKQFDDGLYAAIDLAAQNGVGDFGGKRELLASLVAELTKEQQAKADDAIHTVFAAALLGDPSAGIPANFKTAVVSEIAAFEADALRSKPIGFYTWSPELQRIFRQDRMLQSELQGRASIAAIVERLRTDTASRETYEGYLRLVSRLTNPLVQPNLRKLIDDPTAQVPAGGVYFFPPSRSHETDLVKRLFGNRLIPDGFNLADELVARVSSGDIKLAPRADSGWYDYQTWSLEPLLLPDSCPEASRLALSPTYRDHLRELFKGMLALTRETHIKQLETPGVASAPEPFEPEFRPEFRIFPELTVEPLAEMYRRRAASYRFIRGVLEETFGAQALAGMHRLTAVGPVAESLADELAQMEAIFLGAAVVADRQLGMDPQDEKLGAGADAIANADAASREFLNWSANMLRDADVSQDARMMVPVFYDLARKKTKVWLFMGWSAKKLKVSFTRRPTVTVTNPAGEVLPPAKYDVHFFDTEVSLSSPIVAEVYVSELLDREQFRRHCDAYRTSEAILANLK